METLKQLLSSKGRDYFPENQIERLQKRNGQTTGSLVADAYKEARSALGVNAPDDAIAKRTALLFLKACGVIPAKPVQSRGVAEGAESATRAPATVAPEPPVV